MFITTVLDDMAKRYSDKKAIVCGEASLTFEQLNEQTYNLCRHLAALGVKEGDTVGILLPNCVDYAACFLAPLRVGAISVPLNPRYSREELEAIFKDCQLALLITTAERLAEVEALVSQLETAKALIVHDSPPQTNTPLNPLLSRAASSSRARGDLGVCSLGLGCLLNSPSDEVISYSIRAEDHAAYMYTSGTTGMPKGVILTHGIIASRGQNRRNLDVTAEDKCYTVGGLYHNGKLFIGLVWSLYVGMTFYTDAPFHPQQALERLANDQITLFHASPFHFGVLGHWEALQDIPPLPALRLCLSSGNRVSTTVAQAFEARFGIGITENYGITEAGGLCTDGFAHTNVQIKIISEAGEELGTNQIGEVLVTGAEKAKGYLNRPHLTANVFQDEWFYTGDLGKIDSEGRLHILCRKKNLIVVEGQELYPDEIEEVLRSHPDVEDALVKKGEANDTLPSEGLLALVLLDKPSSVDTLLNFCRKQLPAHKVPRQIEFCQDLPFRWRHAIAQNEFDVL